MLIVKVGLWQDVAGTGSISGITYNGVAMTKAVEKTVTGANMRSEIWFLANPDTGTHNIVATVAGDTDSRKFGASSWTGVEQVNPVHATATAEGSSTSVSGSLTTTVDDCLIIDSESSYTNDPVTVGAGQTSLYNDSTGTTTAAASYLVKETAGLVTMSWTKAGTTDWAYAVVAFLPASVKIQVYINGQDVTKTILKNSLKIENILTRQVDRCVFTIQKLTSGTMTYVPTIGREVTVYHGDTKVFAGNIVKVNLTADDFKIIRYNVECNDYGRRLDRYLISDTWSSTSIETIINSIVADKGLGSEGFTTNNVVAPTVLSSIAFNYEPFSTVLTKLADLVNYDWYVDYDKDIHFFAKDENQSPFDLEDDTGTFIFNTLKITKDNSQIRNVIYVRGGEYLGSNFTSEFISDGTQNVYALPYRYDSLRLSVTGEVFDGGVDGVDIANNFDYMWNKDEKFVRFRGDRIPNASSNIRISGEPFLPVRTKVRDSVSIADMASAEGGSGVYEHLVIDPTINSKEAARDRAKAELLSYSDTLNEGEFQTYRDGLKAGQQINITSAAYDLNEDFIINKVVATPWADGFRYQVTLVTTKTMGVIEFLRNLLEKDRKDIVINENEILDVVESFDENITIVESVLAFLGQNVQEETITVSETVTAQSLNYPTEFVLGDMTPPTGYKRIFILDQSHLH